MHLKAQQTPMKREPETKDSSLVFKGSDKDGANNQIRRVIIMKLTKKQAEKLQTLKTEEEIRAFFETEAVQLDPETLEEVSGGGFDFLRKTIICEECGTEYKILFNMHCPTCGAVNPMYQAVIDYQNG